LKKLLAIILLTLSLDCLAQRDQALPTLTELDGINSSDPHFVHFPLTRDTTGNFPEHLTITGKIVDITVGPSCGIFCGCGTLKVELSNQPDDYKESHVYIAIPCFAVNQNDYLNKTIDITIEILSPDNKDCYWTEMPMNKIDSHGIPFYIPNNLEEKLSVE